MTRIGRQFQAWSVAAMVISITVLAVVTIWYSGKVARDSEQKWCGIVVTLDDSYSVPRAPGAPPPSTVGQRIMDEMKRLRREFDC